MQNVKFIQLQSAGTAALPYRTTVCQGPRPQVSHHARSGIRLSALRLACSVLELIYLTAAALLLTLPLLILIEIAFAIKAIKNFFHTGGWRSGISVVSYATDQRFDSASPNCFITGSKRELFPLGFYGIPEKEHGNSEQTG